MAAGETIRMCLARLQALCRLDGQVARCAACAPRSTPRFFATLLLALRMLASLPEAPMPTGRAGSEEGQAMKTDWRRVLVGTAVVIAFLALGILEVALR